MADPGAPENIWTAARAGDDERVSLLAASGQCDVNSRSPITGSTPLCQAVIGGHDTTVVLLVKGLGAAVNLADSRGKSPLYLAARQGFATTARVLGRLGADPNQADHLHRTPVFVAAENGDDDLVRVFVSELGATVDLSNATGASPLLMAAHEGHVSTVRLLASLGADADRPDSEGRTPVHVAARNGLAACVAALVDLGANATTPDTVDGATPLYAAASNGHASVCRLLVSGLGLDVDAADLRGCTPVFAAAAKGHGDVVKVLTLELGANGDAANGRGRTPLFAAVQGGHDDVVRFLVSDLGVELNHIDDEGWTPIMIAAFHARDSTTELLITEFGADKDASDLNGWTLVLMAAQQGNVSTVRLLVSGLGADLNRSNHGGRTPLYIAAKKGHLEVIRSLCELGADLDSSVVAAVDAARREGHADCVKEIENVWATKVAARRGRLGKIKGDVSAGAVAPFAQWTPFLSARSRQDLLAWVEASLGDASNCYAALFAPAVEDAPASGNAPSPQSEWPAQGGPLFRELVAHDGHRHLQQLITSFLVHPKAPTRRLLRDLRVDLKTTPPNNEGDGDGGEPFGKQCRVGRRPVWMWLRYMSHLTTVVLVLLLSCTNVWLVFHPPHVFPPASHTRLGRWLRVKSDGKPVHAVLTARCRTHRDVTGVPLSAGQPLLLRRCVDELPPVSRWARIWPADVNATAAVWSNVAAGSWVAAHDEAPLWSAAVPGAHPLANSSSSGESVLKQFSRGVSLHASWPIDGGDIASCSSGECGPGDMPRMGGAWAGNRSLSRLRDAVGLSYRRVRRLVPPGMFPPSLHSYDGPGVGTAHVLLLHGPGARDLPRVLSGPTVLLQLHGRKRVVLAWPDDAVFPPTRHSQSSHHPPSHHSQSSRASFGSRTYRQAYRDLYGGVYSGATRSLVGPEIAWVVDLEAGDALYLPPGFVVGTEALDEPSAAIQVTVLASDRATRRKLLQRAIARVVANSSDGGVEARVEAALGAAAALARFDWSLEVLDGHEATLACAAHLSSFYREDSAAAREPHALTEACGESSTDDRAAEGQGLGQAVVAELLRRSEGVLGASQCTHAAWLSHFSAPPPQTKESPEARSQGLTAALGAGLAACVGRALAMTEGCGARVALLAGLIEELLYAAVVLTEGQKDQFGGLAERLVEGPWCHTRALVAAFGAALR